MLANMMTKARLSTVADINVTKPRFWHAVVKAAAPVVRPAQRAARIQHQLYYIEVIGTQQLTAKHEVTSTKSDGGILVFCSELPVATLLIINQ